jgi:hypothetical protein
MDMLLASPSTTRLDPVTIKFDPVGITYIDISGICGISDGGGAGG